MKTTTPLTPQSHELFNCKQHTVHDSKGPDTYNYTMMKYGTDKCVHVHIPYGKVWRWRAEAVGKVSECAAVPVCGRHSSYSVAVRRVR